MGAKTLAATGRVMLSAAVDGDFVPLAPGAFALSGEASSFEVEQALTLDLDLLKLTVPEKSVFRLSLDPREPELAWVAEASRERTESRITLSLPAKGDGFTFEMEQFRIHPAGVDLRGSVRSGPVNLDGAGFDGPIGVKGVQRSAPDAAVAQSRPLETGEIEIRNSVLMSASLQASARLPFFDDAVGTLTLRVSKGEGRRLACAGTLDISGLDEFHLDALYAAVQVDQLQLRTTYTGSGWTSAASMTGRLRFQAPNGRSASDMGELASLFEGVTLEFEDLDPLQGGGSWEIKTLPRRFTFADILSIDLRGASLELKDRRVTGCDLIGDVNIQKLPGIDASLTFGGISLRANGSTPTFTVRKIGATFAAPGGFRMWGELHHVTTPKETGFAGGFNVKVQALPELGGMLKLTRVRLDDGTIAPSLALFVEREAQVQLLYGFYLRRLGIGLGMRQALRGLEPGVPREQRLVRFVENPAGIPDPIFVDNWQPVTRPRPLPWMLVGAGLITFGNLPDDEPHLVAGSILLSLDQDLRLLLGANLWLFTSPRETRDARFIQRPVARGGMELSVRDGYLKAYLRTVKSPQLGKKAPPLLAEVLSKVETSLFFQADRNGFIAEIGWPQETRIDFELGPFFTGKLETGYRYGFYRGVLIYGLNFGITVRLEASQRLSFGVRGASAEASLEVRGEADFRASFVGALDTSDMRGYLMGDVRLNALVSVKASASARIQISKWIKIRISFSATLSISITAALTAAMDSRPAIGFEGTAQVAISVCGYGISGSVAFSYNPGVISDVRSKLEALMPGARGGAVAMELAAFQDEAPTEPVWHYRFHWLDRQPGEAGERLRILLFPAADTPYPLDVDAPGFKLPLQKDSGATFRGFAGSETGADVIDDTLTWTQDLSLPFEPDGEAGLEHAGREYLLLRRAYHEDLLRRRDELKARMKRSQDEDAELRAIEEEWRKLTQEGDNEVQGVLEALADVKAALKDGAQTIPTLREFIRNLGGSHPLEGPIQHPREDPDYDRKLAEASAAPASRDTHELGLLLLELLALTKDRDAEPGRYRVAPRLNLVLEFEAPSAWRQRRDPVPLLVDLDGEIILGNPQQRPRLESVLGRDAPAVEYDLIPGRPHQERDRICLTWDFLREDEAQGGRQGAGRAGFAPYAELHEYVVTRYNLDLPNDRPRAVSVQPAWIVQDDGLGQVFYLRPPYQFIDDRLEDVKEGHHLQYRVEAMAPDRRLAATLIDVVRGTVEPLPLVGQTLALHTVPHEGAQTLTFVAPAWHAAERGEPEESAEAMIGQLRIRHRRVGAARYGAYGYDLRPVPPVRWAEGLPARRETAGFPQVRFAESPEGRAMPWEETFELGADGEPAWTPHWTVLPGDAGFTCTIEPSRWPALEPGQAVEFYIGRYKARDGDRPEQKSDLVKCRHAVADAAPADWRREDGSLDLTRGATVDAFEVLREPQELWEFVPPGLVQLAVAYPQGAEKPEIVVAWPHDQSDEGRADVPFNPVIGYRIHCLDRYDPTAYPLPDPEKWLPERSLATVRAIPERVYRAAPESIVVEGLPGPLGAPAGGDEAEALTAVRHQVLQAEALRAPQDMSQEVRVRLAEARHAKGFAADWIPAWEHDLNAPTGAGEALVSAPDATPGVQWDAGPIYLNGSLATLLDGLLQVPGAAKCRLILHHPLGQRAAVGGAGNAEGAVDAAALQAASSELAAQFDGRTDPYGWWLAEALGLSCECVLLAQDGAAVQAEAVRDHLVARGAAAPCSVAFFRAADGRTLLNVFRVTAAATPQAVHRGLASRILGHEVTGALPAADLQELQEGLDRAGRPRKIRELQHRAAGVTAELPIAADGTLTFRWPAPDLWSHRYAVALEKVRRHDALWRRLRPEPPTAAAAEPRIEAAHFKEVIVDRTRELVPHNLLVTPLPGSLQALVFRHPAAFAATASAVAAAHGQYAGQTVLLERRIEAREALIRLYAECTDWTGYEPYDDAADALAAPPNVWTERDAREIEAVEGTEGGIYGADRYVFPDLPAYYRYRVSVWSSAGRRQSPVEQSDWQEPLHDRTRQRPRAIGPSFAQYDGRTLDITVPIVHSGWHLPPRLRPLWREEDELLSLPGAGARLGDLPDLHLIYQLYLRTNPVRASDGRDAAVYVPLCRIAGPRAGLALAAGDRRTFGFSLEAQAPGLRGGGWSVLTASRPFMAFRVVLQGLETRGVQPLLTGLNSLEGADALPYIALAVQRRGVWSEMVGGSGLNPVNPAEVLNA